MVESTLRYAGSFTQDIRSRGKRWKAIAIAALVLLVCVLIYMGSQWIIETGTDWVLLPASLINIVLLVALAGAFVIGKNKIATLILCGLLIYFTTSFFSGLNQNSLNQIINTAELGSRTPFIPHYAVIIVLLTLSLAVMVITFLIQKKSVSTDLIVPAHRAWLDDAYHLPAHRLCNHGLCGPERPGRGPTLSHSAAADSGDDRNLAGDAGKTPTPTVPRQRREAIKTKCP